MISVHSPGFAPGADEAAVRAAVARLGIEHPVLLDSDARVWTLYDNEGWPARYLFDQASRAARLPLRRGRLRGDRARDPGAARVEREPLAPLRPEDDPEAMVVVPTATSPGRGRGPYVAGAVWAVLDGRGTVRVNGTRSRSSTRARTSCSPPGSTEGVLDLEVGDGVECLAVCFTPGLAPDVG